MNTIYYILNALNFEIQDGKVKISAHKKNIFYNHSTIADISEIWYLP